MHGLDIGLDNIVSPNEAVLVRCELDGYHTLECVKELENGNETMLAVYNPNLEPLQGLFLKVQR